MLLVVIFCFYSVHHTGLTHRLTKIGMVESATKKRYKKSLEKNQTDNAQVIAMKRDSPFSLLFSLLFIAGGGGDFIFNKYASSPPNKAKICSL